MSLVGTNYTIRYVKAGDLRYHGYVKEHYCKSIHPSVPYSPLGLY